MPYEGRSDARGGEARKENDYGERRRSPEAGHNDGNFREAAAFVQERWDRDGGKRERNCGWRSGGGRGARENRKRARAEARGENCIVGSGRSGSKHDGDWAGAVVAEGAAAGGINAGPDGS